MPRPYQPWTNRDVEKLKRVYPITNRAQLQAEFPNRHIDRLRSMAASLKLKKAITAAGRKNWNSIANAHVYQIDICRDYASACARGFSSTCAQAEEGH